MESIFGRDNPFSTEQLESAFYHPTLPKNIDFTDKMTSISSNMMNRDNDKKLNTVFESENFLKKSNILLCDDLPSKDGETECKDMSGSSKFDETWPSTEQSSASPNIDSSSHSDIRSLQKMNLESVAPELFQNSSSQSHSKGTIAGFINRFRNEPPKSREERQRDVSLDKKDVDFWWLKSPDSSSTPKDSDNTFTPPQRLRSTGTKKPPLSPEQRMKRNKLTKIKGKESSSTSLKNIIESDSETARIQKRAERLLELSEGTLSTSSNEPSITIPEHTFIPTMKSSNKNQDMSSSSHFSVGRVIAPSKSTIRPNLHPDDDILYQWRLARKMEKAKETGNVFSKLPQMVIQKHSYTTDSRNFITAENKMENKQTATKERKQDKEHQVDETDENICVGKEKAGKPLQEKETQKDCFDNQRNSKDSFSQTLSCYIHPNDGEKIDVNYVDLPSHIHTVCDILPCPHVTQRHELQKNHSMVDNSKVLMKCNKQKEFISTKNEPFQLNSPVIGFNNDTVLNIEPAKKSNNSSFQTDNVQKYGESATITKVTTASGDHRRNETCGKHNHLEDGRNGKKAEIITDLRTKDSKGKSKENINKDKGMKKVINQVVSDHLFSSSLTSEESFIDNHSMTDKKSTQNDDQMFSDFEENDSEGEYPDDEILKILRQRRANYLQTLRKIEEALSEYPSDQLL